MFRVCLSLPVALLVAGSPGAAQAPAKPDHAAEEAVLKKAGVDSAGPALLEFFRKRTITLKDQKRAEALLALLGNEDFTRREEATRGLKRLGAAALPALRRALAGKDPEVKRRARDCLDTITHEIDGNLVSAAAQMLAARAPVGAVAVLLDYLPSAPDEGTSDDVRMAVISLTQRTGTLDAVLPLALKAPEAARRATAALAVGRWGTAEQRAVVRRLLADPDARVRLSAAQGLLAALDREAVPVLIELVAIPSVADQAEDTLTRLAGSKTPRLSSGTDKPARRKARATWQAWWKANQDKIDLLRADVDLLVVDPTRRATAASRRFLDALIAGNAATVRRLADLPFRVEGSDRFTTTAQLDRFASEVSARSAERKYTYQLTKTVAGEELGRKRGENKSPFEDIPWRQLRVVFFQAEAAKGGMKENLFMVLRVRGGTVRVVAVGNGEIKIRMPPGKKP